MEKERQTDGETENTYGEREADRQKERKCIIMKISQRMRETQLLAKAIALEIDWYIEK
jgi:hypothetical protein